MHPLSDSQIVEAINLRNIVVSGLAPPLVIDDHIGKHSQIQPSSIDLRAGNIFIPPAIIESPANGPIKYDNFVKGYSIPPGNSIIVETLEDITLDGTIAGFGFPPSSLASNAILMTNPGHVDPGYSGKLKFTLINMGRSNFIINSGDIIVTILLFKLSETPKRNYAERNGDSVIPTDYNKILTVLSHDFGNFTDRMDTAAKKAVDNAANSLDKARLWIPAITGAIVTIMTAGAIWLTSSIPPFNQITTKSEAASIARTEMKDLESKINYLYSELSKINFDEKIDSVQQKIIDIESKLASMSQKNRNGRK